MDGKEAAEQIARELRDMWYPKAEAGEVMFKQLTTSAQRNYSHYYTSMHKVEVGGKEYEIEFHHVGRNASHSFDIGLLPDGRLLVRTCGDSGDWDEELDCPSITTRVYIHNGKQYPYVGHW